MGPFIVNTWNRLKGVRLLRYLMAAGAAFTVDVATYTVMFHYIVPDEPAFWLRIKTEVALVCSFGMGFLTNFFISKYFVFAESQLTGQEQLFRFLLVTVVVFGLNILLMNYLESVFGGFMDPKTPLFPFVVRFVAGACIAIVSFFSHKFFSFQLTAQQRAQAEEHSRDDWQDPNHPEAD